MTERKVDPGLEEIRRVRHEISAEIGHDPKKLLEYYRDLEKGYADRLVHVAEGPVDERHTVAG